MPLSWRRREDLVHRLVELRLCLRPLQAGEQFVRQRCKVGKAIAVDVVIAFARAPASGRNGHRAVGAQFDTRCDDGRGELAGIFVPAVPAVAGRQHDRRVVVTDVQRFPGAETVGQAVPVDINADDPVLGSAAQSDQCMRPAIPPGADLSFVLRRAERNRITELGAVKVRLVLVGKDALGVVGPVQRQRALRQRIDRQAQELKIGGVAQCEIDRLRHGLRYPYRRQRAFSH